MTIPKEQQVDVGRMRAIGVKLIEGPTMWEARAGKDVIAAAAELTSLRADLARLQEKADAMDKLVAALDDPRRCSFVLLRYSGMVQVSYSIEHGGGMHAGSGEISGRGPTLLSAIQSLPSTPNVAATDGDRMRTE